jgi:hypothetical protein
MLCKKEVRIPNTPYEYYSLYSECWNDEPKKMHTIEHIYRILYQLSEIDCNCNEKLVGSSEEILNNEGKLI